MGKLTRLLMIGALILGFTTIAAAEFSELHLVRVVYHLDGSLEVAANLGAVKDLITQNNATVGGGTSAFSPAQFSGADWSDLYVAYFAVDSAEQDAWTSGPEGNQTSGSRQFTTFKSASSSIFGYYNTLDGSGAVTAPQSWPNSYWAAMDSWGLTRGGFTSLIPAMNGERNLAALDEVNGGPGHVDQVLYFYDKPNSPVSGVPVATLRTMSNGTTIINPPQDSLPQLNLMVLDAKATEGAPVKDKARFRILRSGDLSEPLVAKLKFSGTAKNGIDYSKLPNKVTIPKNTDRKDISVVPIDDNSVEETETVVLTILPDAAYELGSSVSGTIEIVDNEPDLPVVNLKLSDADATEGTPVTDKGKLQVTRTGDLSKPLIVKIKVTGSTATAKTDYKKLSSSVTIPAGKATKVILVTPVDDSTKEDVETVIVSLVESAAYALGIQVQKTVKIYDND